MKQILKEIQKSISAFNTMDGLINIELNNILFITKARDIVLKPLRISLEDFTSSKMSKHAVIRQAFIYVMFTDFNITKQRDYFFAVGFNSGTVGFSHEKAKDLIEINDPLMWNALRDIRKALES